jgi:hypothetical protein
LAFIRSAFSWATGPKYRHERRVRKGHRGSDQSELSTPYSDHLVEVLLANSGARTRPRSIGDIDLFPLAPGWFKDRIAHIPENNYVHLDADGITQLNGTQYTWANKQLHAGNLR